MEGTNLEYNSSRSFIQRFKACAVLSFLKILSESRKIILILILAYYSYISATAAQTKNWAKTREMGFIQPHYCNSAGHVYGMVDWPIPGESVTKPIGYDSSPSQLCFSHSTLVNCYSNMMSINTGTSGESYSDLFKVPSRNYFPLLPAVFLFTCLALLISFLYESGSKNFVSAEEGGFSNEKFWAPKINLLFCVSNIIVLVYDPRNYKALYQEDCQELYKLADSNKYCTALEQCGMTLASVINPPEALIVNHQYTNNVLACCLGATCFIRLLIDFLDNDKIIENVSFYQILSRLWIREVSISRLNQPNVEIRDELDAQIPERDVHNNNLGHNAQSRDQLIAYGNGQSISQDSEAGLAYQRFCMRIDSAELLTSNPDIAEGDCSVCLSRLVVDDRYRRHRKHKHHKGNKQYTLEGMSFKKILSWDRFSFGDKVDPALDFSEIQQKIIVKMSCEHYFHEPCIMQWLKNHNSCPICRSQFIEF